MAFSFVWVQSAHQKHRAYYCLLHSWGQFQNMICIFTTYFWLALANKNNRNMYVVYIFHSKFATHTSHGKMPFCWPSFWDNNSETTWRHTLGSQSDRSLTSIYSQTEGKNKTFYYLQKYLDLDCNEFFISSGLQNSLCFTGDFHGSQPFHCGLLASKYRSGTVNSKSFVGKVLLQIKRKFELTFVL